MTSSIELSSGLVALKWVANGARWHDSRFVGRRSLVVYEYWTYDMLVWRFGFDRPGAIGGGESCRRQRSAQSLLCPGSNYLCYWQWSVHFLLDRLLAGWIEHSDDCASSLCGCVEEEAQEDHGEGARGERLGLSPGGLLLPALPHIVWSAVRYAGWDAAL